MKNNLAEAVFESRPLVEDARKHLAECGECKAEMAEMEATWKLLDEWQAPEPSAFFDAKLYARLRTEQSNPSPSFFERAKAWLLYSSNLHMRQITVGALATVLAVCGGTFALLDQPQAPVPQASATVRDLQSFDGNAQMFQQLNALDGDEDNATGASN
jgi:anti-sigma factor RsiW